MANHKNQITVGQKVLRLDYGFRYNAEPIVTEETVSKVGRVYFQLKRWPRQKYSIDTLMVISEYSSNARIVLSREEYELERETNQLTGKLRGFFSNRFVLSLDQMRRISQIIDEEAKL